MISILMQLKQYICTCMVYDDSGGSKTKCSCPLLVRSSMYVFLLSPNGPLSKRSLRRCEDHVYPGKSSIPYRVTLREEGSGGVAVSMTVQNLQRRISSACLYNNRKVPSVDWLPLGSAGIVQHQHHRGV